MRPRFRQHVRAGLVRAHKKPRRRTRARLALLADPGYIFFERSCGWHKTNCFYRFKRAQAFLSVLLIYAPRLVAELFCSNFQTATESVLLAIETGVKANTRCQNTFSRGEWELHTRLRTARCAMDKKSPLHVSDATIVIAAGCHGCGGTTLIDYVHCIRW